MKYSKYIGVLAAVMVIVSCYMAWVFIEPVQLTITGMNTRGTNYGKPGLLHIFTSAVAIILFLLPRVWAKRTNLFICALNLAWVVRNYIIITACDGGDCPQKQTGLYILIMAAVVMMVMGVLPADEIEVKSEK
jgi:hypothetical protein